MNNPLPVDRFSVAEAARRTWPLLIESMLDAVLLVEPQELRVVAANAAAGRLYGVAPGELVGRDMRGEAPSAEDAAFWHDAAEGRVVGIASESLVVDASGEARPVLRRIVRVEPQAGTSLFVVALRDRSEESRHARAAEVATAELEATLESLDDAILVTDLAGRVSRFNRRFAELWDVPGEMLVLHAGDEIVEWMRSQVVDPLAYVRRLEEIEREARLPSTDRFALRSGLVVERSTVPQKSRGRPIGRVHTYRVVARHAS